MAGFCIDCGQHYDSFEGMSECAACGTKNLPVFDNDQVDANINWGELRLLIIWAERWGIKAVGGAGTVYAISERIGLQHPERIAKYPLTLAGEIGQVKDEFGDENVETDFPGV